MKLADHVIMSQSGSDLIFASDVIIKFPNCSRSCLDLAAVLRQGLQNSGVESMAVDDDCRELIVTLSRIGFLVPNTANPWSSEPFSSHISYFSGLGLDPIAAQRALLDAHVVILGVGGTGSVVLQHLVGAGVGCFTLIDSDAVEVNNLNRQFIYARGDVGQPKVSAALSYIRSRHPKARVVTHRSQICSRAELDRLNLVLPIHFFVNAADDPACEVIEAVAEYCGAIAAPFLSGGCGFLDGRFGPLTLPERATEYLRSHKSATARATALGAVAEPMQPVSFGPLNTIVGALMARDIIEYLAGSKPYSLDHRVWIDLRRTAISRQPARSEQEDRQ